MGTFNKVLDGVHKIPYCLKGKYVKERSVPFSFNPTCSVHQALEEDLIKMYGELMQKTVNAKGFTYFFLPLNIDFYSVFSRLS